MALIGSLKYWFVLKPQRSKAPWHLKLMSLIDSTGCPDKIDSAWPTEVLANKRLKFLNDPWNK